MSQLSILLLRSVNQILDFRGIQYIILSSSALFRVSR